MKRGRGRPRSAPAADAPAAVGQRIELTLERLTHDGRGIGRWRGRTVFVEGGLPGEQVQARVLRARSKLIETRLETVQQPSPLRQPLRCMHAELCGGCSLQHMSHGQQLEIKQQALAQQLQHFAQLTPQQWAPTLEGPAYGYRQRTRVALRWDRARRQLDVGFRQRASSELVNVEQCPVLVPELEAVLKTLPVVLRSLQAVEALGHVELIGAEHPALVLRHLRPLSEADRQRLLAFTAEHGLGLWLQGEEAAQGLAGALEPAYRLADQQLTLGFAPGDFTQVNPQINQAMVNQALAWLAPGQGEAVLDLFCGVGNFALALARAGAEVTGIEGSVEMVDRATDNARKNGLDQVHFLAADLSKPLEVPPGSPRFTAALLDPPRDGAEQMVGDLAALAVERILYISCNPATLARDAGILAGKGYTLVRAGIMDMFPQTAHVEAMALFRRQ
ncbi:23S rRNA (uracil(1939)-C(5))-methyltransferase RlmD [Halopseudomonas maritima]|uniref:23S rRNA (uracil(1939)-C(5))-methyltransferase RlmD n=1 Tax=Halopseudomonas maritima TaxID=2918528 RepID=UPI001EEB0BDC|nr:23S rRNA (uracil(1939)-C(5))-methyltransferase RlmD [Halopseudomonas maritima]UJJ30752.1 23S rRNA (uracil(1939)-C(5))-methyltransferase RlmD [Halopseudomonas maritima]